MTQLNTLKSLVLKYKYKLIITYTLFALEMLGSLLRFYFFGEAINGLIKGSYNGLIILTAVHLVYIIIGIIRHKYDTRTYTAIYTSLVTKFLSRRFNQTQVSKLSAHSSLAREVTDFLEHDLVYAMEAFYNLFGSLVILLFYDKIIVGICLSVLIPVTIVSYYYGRKMKKLNQQKNDELEKQVDIIASGNSLYIQKHYNNLRNWQIKISDKEAWNFGFIEIVVLIVVAASLLVSKNIYGSSVMAGSLFGIYSYILKFTSGLDAIPYTLQRLSSLSDITRRIESQEEDIPDGDNSPEHKRPFTIINKTLKQSA